MTMTKKLGKVTKNTKYEITCDKMMKSSCYWLSNEKPRLALNGFRLVG